MDGIWTGYGRDMDGIWTGYGRDMDGIWTGIENKRFMENEVEGGGNGKKILFFISYIF
jgi:hypothetical protein